MKQVSNPLTIIAIFAGLSETISGIVAGIAHDDLMIKIFLVGFPVFLVILFFVTLNFNSSVLYSPSDFRDDKSYLKVLEIGSKKHYKIQSEIKELNKLVESVSVSNPADEKIKAVKEKLIELEHTNNSQENARRFLTLKNDYQDKILNYIKGELKNSSNKPLKFADFKNTSFSEPELQLALDYLENEWAISYNKEKEGYVLE